MKYVCVCQDKPSPGKLLQKESLFDRVFVDSSFVDSSFHNSPFHQTGILRHPPTSFVLITPPTIYDFPDFCSFLVVTTRVTWIYSLVRLVVPNTEELISRLFMGL